MMHPKSPVSGAVGRLPIWPKPQTCGGRAAIFAARFSLLTLAVVLLCSATANADVRGLLSDDGDTLPMGLEQITEQLKQDPGISFDLASSNWEQIQQRLSVRNTLDDQQVIEDPQSKLSVLRRIRYIPQLNSVLIESTLRNGGSDPIGLARFSVVDWTISPRATPQDRDYDKLEYRTEQWYGSTFWSGPDWTRVGKDWHHSGVNTASVRRFVAPRNGKVRISGRIFKADTNQGGGDGVRVMIRVGEREIWRHEIDGNDDRGVAPDLEIPIQQGESIRFVVHRRGSISYDTTHWDPVITYDDGQAFRASDAFDAHRQGQDGWYYEMDTSEQTPDQLAGPAVHVFGPGLASRLLPVAVDRALKLRPDHSFPVWLVTDRFDSSGILITLPNGEDAEFCSRWNRAHQLHLQVTDGRSLQDTLRLQPGQSHDLPTVVLTQYRGSWPTGLGKLNRLLRANSPDVRFSRLVERLTRAARESQIPAAGGELPELDYCSMIQADWRQQDQLQDTVDSYETASRDHLARARRLLDHLLQIQPATDSPEIDFRSDARQQIAQLSQSLERALPDLTSQRSRYLRIRWLKRRIALSNPLFDFGPMLFCKRVPTSYSHLVMQYYGWRARPGGGIFILDQPGVSLHCRSILERQLPPGNVLEPRLSFDGQEIVFSYVSCRQGGYEYEALDNESDEGFYHVWSVNIDGSGLRQLTSGPFDDLMPTWLPDGDIVFSSTRRRGYARCFGAQFSRRWHVYTLHRMDRDGADLRCLSVHDTNEWFPVVSPSGHILYSRWDYIDRDAVTHQNLWAMRPDGSNTIAVWGNATASPHCTFQPQPIPNSNKIVFTASAHHSITAGSIAILDPARGDNGQQAIQRITPEIAFPEAEGRDIQEYYASPWPLSEDYFLVAYSPYPLVWEPGANKRNALGIYLLDAAGNRELIYRDPEIGSTNPTPLIARHRPPVIPDAMIPAAASEPSDEQVACSSPGEVTLINVYEGLGDIAPGTIKSLRIIQIFPKTTPVADSPKVGLAREENARAILGTVPVEPDGSARFLVPSGKPLLFQALDEQGRAYQTMRTIVYFQPGESTSCIGCHEHRSQAPQNIVAAALRKPPSSITPGPLDGRPFSFMKMVQPVLDRYCIDCHGQENPDGSVNLTASPHDGFTRSYWALCGDADFWGPNTNPETARKALVPRFGGRNQIQVTPPGGIYGARGSRLMQLLDNHHADVVLDQDSVRRIATWIDCNAIFYGVYRPEQQLQQLQGLMVDMPSIQ
jgi:hypothetical protein